MRVALWFLGLFGTAVALALFAGNNQGTVTLFWPPYRLDLSLNLVVLLLIVLLLFIHLALRALAADPARRAELGANGRRYAERELGRDVILSRFESQLKALVQGQPA